MATGSDTAALIDAVWGRLQARLEVGLRRIERIVSSLFDRRLEQFEIAEATDVGGLVAAKLGLLGLGPAADLVRKAMAIFSGPELGVSEAIALASLLDDARLTVATAVSEIKLLTYTGEPVALVGSISETLDELLWIAASQGLPVSHYAEGIHGSSRAAAVVVLVDDPDLSRSKSLLRQVRESHPSQPLMLLAPLEAPERRAAVIDLVTTVLPRSLHPLEVVAETRREITRHRHAPSVSVFGTRAELLAEPLWHRGLTAQIESSIETLLQRLATDESRAVVLMPDTGALRPVQLLGLIRTDRRTRSAVVIMISEPFDAVEVRAARRAGADDVFGVNVDPDDLASSIKARLKRRSELEPIMEPGEHPGTVPWPTATIMIERMLLLGFRRNTPVGLALVRLPRHTGGIHGDHQDLDEAIAAEFRSEDVIARLDAEHLVIALQGVARRTLLQRLHDLRQRFALDDMGCRAIALEFPIDGRSLADLVDEGHRSLERVIGEQGPWLVGADWRPWAAEAADVMLVDPDATLGSVLCDVLNREGFRVIHQPDALTGLDDLTGRNDQPLPRVVLMDLDQRGIDGLQFLRQLRQAGVLHRCKVIVFSARSHETDFRHAFELGAEDFVTKPFSTPLLVHRLRRVLRS